MTVNSGFQNSEGEEKLKTSDISHLDFENTEEANKAVWVSEGLLKINLKIGNTQGKELKDSLDLNYLVSEIVKDISNDLDETMCISDTPPSLLNICEQLNNENKQFTKVYP